MSRPPEALGWDEFQRQQGCEPISAREAFRAGYYAAKRERFANEARQPDRRIPRECGCIAGNCTQEPTWSVGVRCKARMAEGFETMEAS